MNFGVYSGRDKTRFLAKRTVVDTGCCYTLAIFPAGSPWMGLYEEFSCNKVQILNGRRLSTRG